MKYSSEKELLVVVILGLVGLSLLWLLIPVPVSMFTYLPLFLFSYLLAIFLPGYTFLSFIKPDMSFRTRLEMGIFLSVALLFLVTLLFLVLEIPLAFTYAISVLMILTILLSILTYLGEKIEDKGKMRSPTQRKPSPEPRVEQQEKTPKSVAVPDDKNKAMNEAQEGGEKLEHPPQRRTRLTPPEGEVEVIIPEHVKPPAETAKNPEDEKTRENVKSTSPGKPALKFPWIEREKELNQKKKNSL